MIYSENEYRCEKCNRIYGIAIDQTPGNRDHEEMECPHENCNHIVYKGVCNTVSVWKVNA